MNMTSEQALNILDQLVASMNLNRANHIKAQQAVDLLKITIQPKKKK